MTPGRRPFLDFLEDSVVVFDGGMGTELYRRGVFVNRCFDELSLSSPDLVRQVHLAYVDVGADVIETNSFGANRVKLTKYGFGDQTVAINRASARLARRAAGGDVYVAGAIGPLGIRIEPWGPTSVGEAEEYFREQAAALAEGGVDLFIVETFSDIAEIAAAIRAARSVADLPVIASMTIEEDGNSLEGTAPEVFAAQLDELGAEVVGVNCSVGPAAMLAAVERMAEATRRRILAMPNAGRPRNIDGRNLNLCSPEYVASYARRYVQAGARIVGGCCGTTPDHIRAIRRTVRSAQPSGRAAAPSRPARPVAVESSSTRPVPRAEKSGFARLLAERRFVLCAEILPPRGWDATEVLEGARHLKTRGVDAVVIPERPGAVARMTPLALGQLLAGQAGIEPVIEYGCRDRNLLGMQCDLLGAWVLGVRNLVVVTGPAGSAGQYPMSPGVFEVDSIGLTNMVARLNRGIDIGGNPVGRPTGFHLGVWLNPGSQEPEREVSRFEWKVDAGAEYAFTHPVFDAGALERFLEKVGRVRVPTIASVQPLSSSMEAESLINESQGVYVPEDVLRRLRDAEEKGGAREEGIRIAMELVDRLRGLVEGVLVSLPHGQFQTLVEVLDLVAGATARRNG